MKFLDRIRRLFSRRGPEELTPLFTIGRIQIRRLKCDICHENFEDGDLAVTATRIIWKIEGGPCKPMAHFACAALDSNWSRDLRAQNPPVDLGSLVDSQ